MSRSLSAVVLAFVGVLLSFQGLATAKDVPATRYLAFQMFTDLTAPGAPVGESGVRPLGLPRDRDAMRQFVGRLVEQIGTTGDTETKLAFIIGPLALDYTDEQLRQMIADAFAIALEQNIAVGFHIDDSMFWARRADLWQDPANVEWLDWEGTPNTGRMIVWGPEPTRLAPQMCFNSPTVEEAVRHVSGVIGNAVSEGMATLEAQGKPELFAGVIVGWETMIGRDFENNQLLGYCALTNRGFSREHLPEDLDREREQIVQAFIELWAQGIAEAGIDPAQIYSHTAVTSDQTYETLRANRPEYSELTYSQVNQFAPPWVSFGEHYQPGFSTYPQPGLMDQLYAELAQHGSPGWASSEGANIDPATLTSGGSMETYLAWMFNHGAALVNIFGWGLPPETNPFRLAAEAPEALDAYRKFLGGEPLVEGEYRFPDLRERVQRIQTELPVWLQQHPERQAEIAALLTQLDQYIRANNYAEASRVADEILAIIDEAASSGPAQISGTQSCDPQAEYPGFAELERVTIEGYDDHAMEPFLTRDGSYLLFNNWNDPSVNTNLHWARRIDDLTFEYMGEIGGTATADLEGVPTMDVRGTLYFISTRSYPTTFSTIYSGQFADGVVTNVQLVPEVSREEPGMVNFDAEISADGEHLYFVDARFTEDGQPQTADLVIAERQGDAFVRLPNSADLLVHVNTDALEYAAAISADERELFFTRIDLESGNPTPPQIYRAYRQSVEEPFFCPERVSGLGEYVEAAAFSPDEEALYYHRLENQQFVIYRVTRSSNEGLLVFGECDSAGVSQIVTYDLDTDMRTALTNGADMRWFPAWSPDGSQIAYVYEQAADNSMQIWIMNADGSDNRPLVVDGTNIAPSWSPDGTHLVYAHADAGEQPLKLWLIRIADGARRPLLPDTPAEVDENVPRFSPDGRQIVFTSNRRGLYEIWVVDVQNPDTLRPLTTAYHDDVLNADIEQKVPAWSPDGRQIAYWQGVEMTDPRPDLPRDVWIMNADGSDPRLLTPGDDPNWSPDGSRVIYSRAPIYPVRPAAIGAIQPDGGGGQILVEVNACRPLQSSWTGGIAAAGSGG